MVKSLKEFCENGSCELMPSGAQAEQSNTNKRRAIGFGRENETIERSAESILLETLGKRRAVGFGRENEPAAQPSKPKTKIGFQQIAQSRDRSR